MQDPLCALGWAETFAPDTCLRTLVRSESSPSTSARWRTMLLMRSPSKTRSVSPSSLSKVRPRFGRELGEWGYWPPVGLLGDYWPPLSRCPTESPVFKTTFYSVLRYGRLTNDVVIVSGEQWRDSAIHVHVSILPQTPLPSRLPHNVEQSSVDYPVCSCWLFILNIAVWTCPFSNP